MHAMETKKIRQKIAAGTAKLSFADTISSNGYKKSPDITQIETGSISDDVRLALLQVSVVTFSQHMLSMRTNLYDFRSLRVCHICIKREFYIVI
jgi:hypothetical protein